MRTQRGARLLAAGMLALALGGCGVSRDERAALTTFGGATTLYADTVGTVATETQDNADRLRVAALGLASDESERAFRRAVGGDFGAYVNSRAAREHVALMVGLAASLRAYGQALVELATYGDDGQRVDAMVGIAGNLSSALELPAARGALAGRALGFGTAQVLEAVKKGKLADVVAAFRPGVSAAVAILKSEFRGDTEGTLFFAYKTAIDAFGDRIPDLRGAGEQWRTGAAEPLPTTPSLNAPAAATRYLAYLAAAQARQEIATAKLLHHDQLARYEALRTIGVEASDALEATNDRLARAIADNSLTLREVEDFARRAASLYQTASAVR